MGLTLVGKGLGKTFRIIGLDGRKCRWVCSGTRFSLKLPGQLYTKQNTIQRKTYKAYQGLS